MQHAACSAVAGLWLPAVDPGEHERGRGPVSVLLLPLVLGLREELAHLLVHDVQIIVDVIGPKVCIGQLDRHVERIVEPEPVDYVLVMLGKPMTAIAAYGFEQLASVQHLSSNLSTWK